MPEGGAGQPGAARFQVWIDRGGTFTDCLGLDPATGRLRTVKLLSSDRAPLLGIRRLLGLSEDAPIPPCEIRMGTTIATNALLERRGARCVALVTEGFEDLLHIGDQTRAELFALDVRRPPPLCERVIPVPARLSADGVPLLRPDPAAVRKALTALRADGIESVAISLLHAYLDGALEREIADVAREVGFAEVSLSHEVAGEQGYLARTQTTVVDAYLTPLIKCYVATLRAELPGSTLRIMQSSGGLIEAEAFRGRNAILSGPAGGVVAYAHVARGCETLPAVGFDMGGTSTDVSRYGAEGGYERIYESVVAGVPLRAPSMRIHTVAAGGGSICRFDGERFTVGPDSAGANPGPLCYGRPEATALSLTDVNVALGRVLPDHFPWPLDRERVMTALATLAEALRARGDDRGALGVAEGFFEVAVEHMAQAIRKVSISRGHDVRDHAMVVFGGAGGQHACAIARRLGVRTLVFHPHAGVLSAYGMGVADSAGHAVGDAGRRPLSDTDAPRAAAALAALESKARAQVQADLGDAPGLVHRRVDLRYAGTETALTLDAERWDGLPDAFTKAHARRFGYARPDHPIELVNYRVEVIAPGCSDAAASEEAPQDRPAPGAATARLRYGGETLEVPVVPRATLAPGDTLSAPAIITETTGTIVLEPGFSLAMGEGGVITVTATGDPHALADGNDGIDAGVADPVRLEVFANLFMSIAEQMGGVLQRTALSTNIRERLDFSCAVFDADGNLVANAPHIPVHLGAMGASVQAVVEAHPAMQPGDVFATNDPTAGGSHIPDVTMVTPVFDPNGSRIFFTASRGHHADIGGITPGSMPPFSRTLDEEGVLLRALPIVRGGRFDEALLSRVLTAGPHPARAPAQNLADLQAQVAANRAGARLLGDLVERFGLPTVQAYMGHVQHNAEAQVRRAIAALPDGSFRFQDAMDDGTPIAVTLEVSGDRMRVDFAGTGPRSELNLNAPRAVTAAAVLYVLRVLVAQPIPLNHGCLRAVDLEIPPGSLLDPTPTSAVVAGNVETSQRLVDVLLGALGKLAACQGTMNNLTFGDGRFGYYETIAGGAGAGDGFAGGDAVHTHMTNTRITDPEVLEARFPIRLWRFGLRRGSGGAGRFRGGDGVIRELEALSPLSFSILSERRARAPFGLAGGGDGAPGRNFHAEHALPGRAHFEVAAGERVVIETPGGGGYGEAPADGEPRP